MKRLIRITPVLLLTAGLFSCGNHEELKNPQADADTLATGKLRPDQQLRNARISLYNKAVLTTDIEADYIEKYEKQDSALAWVLKVIFYDSAGQAMSHLTSDSGLVRERSNFMIANGHVLVLGQDSSRLETEQLIWDGRMDMFRTDAFVKIIQKGNPTSGFGMEADRNLTRIKIKNQVSGQLQGVDTLKY